MLLHDIGKPLTKTTDENGIDHFYEHNTIGSDMALSILQRLRYDNHTTMRVRDLILHHDAEIQPTTKSIKRWLNKTSEETVRDLLKVKQADILAQNPIYYQDRHDNLKQINILLDEILQEQQCFSKKDLAINGNDLIAIGVKQGKEIGRIIDELVEYVIDNPDMNTKDKLIEYVSRLKE
jgi:tRNA nucleotidyltransferase (CCA-adding enzyme)